MRPARAYGLKKFGHEALGQQRMQGFGRFSAPANAVFRGYTLGNTRRKSAVFAVTTACNSAWANALLGCNHEL